MINILLYFFALAWPGLSLIVLYDAGVGALAIDFLRLFSVLLIFLTFLARISSGKRFKIGVLPFLCILFLFYFITSNIFHNGFFSGLRISASSTIDLYLVPLAIYISVLNGDKLNHKIFFRCFLMSGLFIALVGIAEFIAHRNLIGTASRLDTMFGYQSSIYRANGPFYDIIGYSGVLLLFVPIIYLGFKKKWIGPINALAASGVIILGCVVSFSRATMLALIIVLAALAIDRRMTKNFIFAFLFIFIIGVFLFFSADLITGSSFFKERISNLTNVTGRWNQYQSIFGLLKENFIFGIGFGRYLEKFHIQIHNSYLRALLEFGLLGFIPYVSYIFSIVLYNFRRIVIKFFEVDAKVSLSIAIISILVANTIDLLNNRHFMLALLLIVGFLQQVIPSQSPKTFDEFKI